ncbi:MAG: hypothetical protein ACOVNR_00165 [Chitinophagaceae bacterium]
MKLLNLILKMPLDKQLHYLHGYRWSIVVFFLMIVFPVITNTLRVWEVAFFSCVITGILVGIGKEIYDLRKGGSGFSWPDFYYTMVGIVEANTTIALMLYIFNWTCRTLAF